MTFSELIRRHILPSLAVLLLLMQSAFAVDEVAIASPVDRLHSALLENMKLGEKLDYSARYDKLEPVINDNFDVALISKVILGRYWREMDQQAQAEFIELFRQLTTATYASRFDSYGNHRFSVVAIEGLRKQRHLVKTELLAEGEETVALDYIVQSYDGTWKIISVIANGVNDLSLKRAEYGAVIRERGYDSLVADIQAKITVLQQE